MIIHIETSIKEKIKSKETINNLGKQLAQEKLDGMKKDKIISEMGKHQTKLSFELMQTKGEVQSLKRQMEKITRGGEK